MLTENFITHYKDIWEQCPDSFPLMHRAYSKGQRRDREALFQEYTGKYKTLQRELRLNGTKPDSTRFFTGLGSFLKNVYDFSDEALTLVLHPDMVKASQSFYGEAKAFDPELQREDIFQAMRNAWIMNGLQLMLGKPVRLTPSILAYSLLYPYSDNYLDDPSVSEREKMAFSKRFERRLMGLQEMGNDYREQRISRLVAMIEEEYPKSIFPEVHGSLLAIHHAQTRSIRLSAGEAQQPEEDEILSVIFDKGGTSVLADGYLVAGHLSSEMQRFLFGYGVWLQLADDIQDVKEDLQSGTRTLFSGNRTLGEKAGKVNRTVEFGRRVMADITYCPEEICDQFCKVILHSIELLVIQSAGLQGQFFPKKYLDNLEEFSPVGFRFLREAREKGSPGRFRLMSQLITDPE